MSYESLVIEGPSGCGKSTVLKSFHSLLGWPMYRPFRTDAKQHHPGEHDAALKRLGVPVNTWMEDLFTSDFLQATRAHVMLDRSMPSALAYEVMGMGTGLDANQRLLALGAWSRRIKLAGTLIVHVCAPIATCAARSGRFTEAFISCESEYINRQINMAGELGVPVVKLYTGEGFDVSGQVIRFVRMHHGWS